MVAKDGSMLLADIQVEDMAVGDLHDRYLEELARIVQSVGIDTATSETGLDRSRLEALPEGDAGFTLAEATTVLALSPEYDEAEDLRREVRDHLILTMSSAVVDVDDLATAMGGDLDAREYQQMIEGRAPLPLREYARIYHYITAKKPD